MSSNNSEDTVQLQYCGRYISAVPGQRLLDVILDSGIEHRHICGGHGFCTSCRVEIIAGHEHLSPVSPLERERLGPLAGAIRLACQTHIQGPAHVRPAQALSSRFSPHAD